MQDGISNKVKTEKYSNSSLEIMELSKLKSLLNESKNQLSICINENNKLKMALLDKEKEKTALENQINSSNILINKLGEKNEQLQSENNSNKDTINNLNNKIFELTQKIKSNEAQNKIGLKLIQCNNNDINDTINIYKLSLDDLQNKINELEVKNSKLQFDNNNLLSKIKSDKLENQNEVNILKNIFNKEKESYEKNISTLNYKIRELILAQNNYYLSSNNISNENLLNKKEILAHFEELENKLRKVNEEKFILQKENQQLRNDNEELIIINNSKEEAIIKLQQNYEKNKDNENVENINNNISTDFMIKKLTEENQILKSNFETITQGINEANSLFLQKQSEYEKAMTMQNEKIKEYRNKISVLKTKINELYNEINYYKNNNGTERNKNEYFGKFGGKKINSNNMSPFLKNDSIEYLGLKNTNEYSKSLNKNIAGRNSTEKKIIVKDKEGKKDSSGGKMIKDEDK